MSISKEVKKRTHITQTGNGLKIVIPTEKFWLFYMTIMIAGALILFGMPVLNSAFHQSSGLFLITTVIVLVIFYLWAWDVFGNEIIVIDPNNLCIKKEIFGTGISHRYDVSKIKNLRLAPKFTRYEFFKSMITEETIAFDYRGKTYRFAAGIDQAEIKDILVKILEKFPRVL